MIADLAVIAYIYNSHAYQTNKQTKAGRTAAGSPANEKENSGGTAAGRPADKNGRAAAYSLAEFASAVIGAE